jgi:hypothetical protein
MLIVLGGGLGFLAAGFWEYGRREPSPRGTVREVGEDIRRRRGDDVAADYYVAASRVRASIAAKSRPMALVGLVLVVTGAALLLSR